MPALSLGSPVLGRKCIRAQRGRTWAKRVYALREGSAFRESTYRTTRARAAAALYDRWFMKPIPPKNVALNLPMNYLLRDFWQYPSDIVPN